MALRLAWYGDDFTGASDTLATVAAAGWRTVLFTQTPSPAQLASLGPLNAVGVAGTARALAPAEQQAELLPVRNFFASLQPKVTLYKCCSTFDSAPALGNLAVGLDALRTPAHQTWVPIVGGQPSLGRYCAFGNLYASATAGGEVYRIDRHPTMSRHPVTPMHEADLRIHLAAQGLSPVGLLDTASLDACDQFTLETKLDAQLRADAAAVLMDATRHGHLARIGGLIWRRAQQQPLLALGASSVAQALIADSQGLAEPPTHPCHVEPASGPVLLMVGSLSPVTAEQVACAEQDYARLELPAHALTHDAVQRSAWAQQCAQWLNEGRSVLAQMSAPNANSADAGHANPTPRELAQAGGLWLKEVLALAPQVRRVGVAGGDTSSFALRALNAWALRWAGSLAPGVHVLKIHAETSRLNGLELMLKGGQMGPKDVFQRLIRGTHTDARPEPMPQGQRFCA